MEKDLEELIQKLRKNTEISKESHTCDKCKDKGYVFKTVGLYDTAIKCECQKLKEVKEKMSRSGIGDLLDTKRFDNYEVNKEYQKAIKEKSIEFTKDFLKGNRHSLVLLGQSGIGKTHILSAVSRKLIENNVSVRHYIADEVIQTLQACKFDEENYNREFGKIANCGVLFIDDLFKTSIQNYHNKESININDLREVFKIINYRYNKKLPVLISSEIHLQRLTKLDEALAGRLKEMCNSEYLISVSPDTDKNYRLN